MALGSGARNGQVILAVNVEERQTIKRTPASYSVSDLAASLRQAVAGSRNLLPFRATSENVLPCVRLHDTCNGSPF